MATQSNPTPDIAWTVLDEPTTKTFERVYVAGNRLAVNVSGTEVEVTFPPGTASVFLAGEEWETLRYVCLHAPFSEGIDDSRVCGMSEPSSYTQLELYRLPDGTELEVFGNELRVSNHAASIECYFDEKQQYEKRRDAFRRLHRPWTDDDEMELWGIDPDDEDDV